MVERKAVLIALVAGVIVMSVGYLAWTFDLGALQNPVRQRPSLLRKRNIGWWLVQ